MTDDAVLRLADRQQITDLLVRYCVALDRMELAELASLFTTDCRVAYGPDPRLQSVGAESLAQSLQRMWRWSRTSHHLSNVLIEFDGEATANVVSYVLAWHERPDGSTATVYGKYLDRVVRKNGGWRIAERRMVKNGSDAGFRVDLFPASRRSPPEGWVAPDIERR